MVIGPPVGGLLRACERTLFMGWNFWHQMEGAAATHPILSHRETWAEEVRKPVEAEGS